MNDNGTQSMTLRDYWRAVVRRKWLIVVAVVTCTAPAVALTLAESPTYESTARVLLQSKPGESLFGSNVVSSNADRAVANEINVLEGDVVYQQLKTDLGLVADPPTVSGVSETSTDVIAVSVQSGDPDTAAILANAYVQAYTTVKRTQAINGLADAGRELQSKVTDLQAQVDAIDLELLTATPDQKTLLDAERRQLVDTQSVFKQRLDQIQVDSALTSGSAQLIQPAVTPTGPIAPTPARTAVLAVVVGLLLGLFAALLVDHLDDSIRTSDDLAKLGSDVLLLAVIPADRPPDHRPVALSRPDDVEVEAYRSLRTNVQFIGFERDCRVIEITSSVTGEGKTTTAANLAVVLAQAGSSVVLVDADLRRPRVHELFAIGRTLGLVDNLLRESIDLTVHPIDDHLSILPAGRIPSNPSEMLSGNRMAAVIEELKARFDYVIVDTAPTLPVSDAIALSRHVDGVLFVAQAGRTSLAQVRLCLGRLDQVSAPLLGVVLNRAKQRNRRREYGTAYGYGYESSGSYVAHAAERPDRAKPNGKK